jgi:C4-dicarboxylate-specific signal transduction histidine kinase
MSRSILKPCRDSRGATVGRRSEIAKGNIVKWFGSSTDSTDGKRAEEALRESERELQNARNELEKKVAERTAELRRSEAYLAEAQRLSHTGSWAWSPVAGEIRYWSERASAS